MNEGKRFENNFKKSLGDYCIRLYDTTNGFAGVKNPCDYIYYFYPLMCMFELKSVKEDKLYFSNISQNQWDSLTLHSKNFGTAAGVCVEFRCIRKAYFIPIQLLNIMKNGGSKSVSADYCKNMEYIVEIPTYYKRTNFLIDSDIFEARIKANWILIQEGGM